MADERLNRRVNDSLETKIDQLIAGLSSHMTDEEQQIKESFDAIRIQVDELTRLVNAYFFDLDSRTHVKHHSFIDNNIKKKDESDADAKKLKFGIIEKGLLVFLTAALTYIASIVFDDFKNKVKEPAHVVDQPVQVQRIPPSVPTHP